MSQYADVESVPDFRARVRDAVGDMGGGVLAWGAPEGLEWIDALETVVIEGGEEHGHENFAQYGDTLIERRDGESRDDFHRRAREAAVAAGAACVVFGGLRLMNVNDD